MSKFWLAALLAAMITVAPYSGAVAATAKELGACPTVEIVPIARKGDAGARLVPGPKGAVAVSKVPLATTHDVLLASPATAEGQPVLNLTFRPVAASALRSYTAGHVGEEIAFVVNGKAVKVPKILDPIVGDGILVGPVAPGEANPLAAALNRCIASAQ